MPPVTREFGVPPPGSTAIFNLCWFNRCKILNCATFLLRHEDGWYHTAFKVLFSKILKQRRTRFYWHRSQSNRGSGLIPFSYTRVRAWLCFLGVRGPRYAGSRRGFWAVSFLDEIMGKNERIDSFTLTRGHRWCVRRSHREAGGRPTL